MALLPEEPAGLVVTRAAGRAEVRATLLWRDPADRPETPTLPQPPSDGRYRRFIRETDDPVSASRALEGEVRALDEGCLARALEETLRGIVRVAALTGAVLETRAVRTAPPLVGAPRAVQSLARELHGAGFPVRFGCSWSAGSAPEADVCLGTGGDPALERFALDRPAWRSVGNGR